MMQIVEHPDKFHVHITYDRFRQRNTVLIKRLHGARFDWTRKTWIVPFVYKNDLKEIQKKTKALWNIYEAQKPQEVGEIDPMPELDFEIDIQHNEHGFTPRPYQLQGIARGLELKRFINGDEQGLGKTLQSLGTLYVAEKYKKEDVFPALVICPSSTKINWKREWEMWTDKKAMVLETKTKDTWHRFHELGMNDVFITNYESLKKYFVKSMPKKGRHSREIVMDERIHLFKSIIIDESHRCKDPSTQQAKITLQICLKKEWVLLLTGTPVVNKPIDLYPQLAIMGRLNEFGGRKGYLGRYCEGGRGASNLKELNYYLNKRGFFRREKTEVAKDLPEKQRQTILCDITTRREYNKAKNDFVNFLKDKGCDDKEIARKLRGEIMVKMGELKRISAKGKMKEVVEFAKEVQDSGEKLILFCTLHSIVDELKNEFPNAVTVTGRDSV